MATKEIPLLQQLFRGDFGANYPLYRLVWPVGTHRRLPYSRERLGTPPGCSDRAVYRVQKSSCAWPVDGPCRSCKIVPPGMLRVTAVD